MTAAPAKTVEMQVQNDHLARLAQVRKPILAVAELVWNAVDADRGKDTKDSSFERSSSWRAWHTRSVPWITSTAASHWSAKTTRPPRKAPSLRSPRTVVRSDTDLLAGCNIGQPKTAPQHLGTNFIIYRRSAFRIGDGHQHGEADALVRDHGASSRQCGE